MLTKQFFSGSSKWINIILLIYSLNMLLIPLRLLGIFNIVYFSLPIIYSIALYLSLKAFLGLKLRNINYLEVLLILYPLLLLPVSIISKNDVFKIITDIIKPLMFIGVIVYFRNAYVNIRLREMKFFCNLLLFTSALNVVFIIYWRYIYNGRGVHLSATDIVLTFSGYFFLLKHYYLLFSILFALLIIGGKLGAFLSFVFTILLYTIRNFSSKQKIITLFFFILCIFFTFRNFHLINKFFIFEKVNLITNKTVEFINFNKEYTVLDIATGGRISEIISSLSLLKKSPELILTGAGPGYTYFVESKLGIKKVHGVHFSPVSILTIYGIFYLIILYLYLFKILCKSYKFLKLPKKFWFVKLNCLFVISNFLNSFTAYSIFTVLLFPVSIGIITNNSLHKEMLSYGINNNFRKRTVEYTKKEKKELEI